MAWEKSIRGNAGAEASDMGRAPDSRGDPQAGTPQAPALSLPKGGGAIRGIDEKFSVNPATGTVSLSVPLPLSPGRGGLSPSLSLTYDSGAGNGPFGLGWSLSAPQVSRKTEKTLPRYGDGEDTDVFLLSGAEDLVPALKEDGSPDAFVRDGFAVRRYRPRVDGLFARIERWTAADGGAHWRSTDKDNVTSIYGRASSARIADPADPRRVYKWLLEEVRDDRGNVVLYEYKAEDTAGIPPSDLSEKNRPASASANAYIKRVFYGNQAPFQSGGWHFQAVFDYGEHDEAAPAPSEVRPWPRRADAFSFHRAGFDIRTRRLCRRILMFHSFDELGPAPCLVRSTSFHYQEDPAAAKLLSVTESGHIRAAGGYSAKSLPPLEFTYAEAVVDQEVRSIGGEALEAMPEGLGGARAQWVDLDGEGISGLLTEEPGAWLYKRNLGGGSFGPLETVAARPSPGLAGDAQLVDLANEGRKSLVRFTGPMPGYFGRDAEGRWDTFTAFPSMPVVNWKDPNQRLLDLNGDGLPEVLITEDEVLAWHPSLGKGGFGPREWAPKARDEERGPAVLFADAEHAVYLADMTGDGLMDIVRVRNGEVCYWPNLGWGRFGAKVSMADAPVFDFPDQFSQGGVRLVDIDGTGPSDILYLGRDGARFWTNQAGNSWGAPQELHNFPKTNDLTTVAAVDLLGSGTACLVWSSSLPGDAERPLRYIDLTGGVKPHLLLSMKNNMGAETRVRYASSTKFYLQDRMDGSPWVTKLAFPVHVVERSEVYDHVTGSRFVAGYTYHHGYYDAAEQEFRGFGRVERTDAEEYAPFQGAGLFPPGANALEAPLHVPPVLTKTWYHTGAFLDGERISARLAAEYYADDLHPQAAPLSSTVLPSGLSTAEQVEAVRALKGSTLRQEIYALDGTDRQPHPYTVSERSYRVRRLQPAGPNLHAVFLSHASETVEFHYERNPDDPRVSHQIVLETDAFGHAVKSAAVAYPRRVPLFPEQAAGAVTCTEHDLLNAGPGDEAHRLGVAVETRTYELVPAPPQGARYRPEELLAALAAAVEIPHEAAPAPGTKRLIERGRQIYWKDDLSGPLPLGQAGSRALPHEGLKAVFTPGLVAAAYGGRVTEAMLADDGKYVFQDGLWWAPSGRQEFAPAVFFAPVRSVDPFGNVSSVVYDSYGLLPERTESSGNPVLNSVARAENDYRRLSPGLLTDANGNRTAVRFDELGLVTATAVMGKEGEFPGDTLDDPTTRLEYDVRAWMEGRGPVSARIMARERHGADGELWQEAREYSDGFGRVVQRKLQAEPAPGSEAPRWLGNGRLVLNNKGKPVKQYEPFFSGTAAYEDEPSLVMAGVTPVIRYDPLLRIVRTDGPDGTFSKSVFGPWRQEAWDANDTVLESLWYAQRGSPDPSGPEPADAGTRAAWLAARHGGTPLIVDLDALGRPFLTTDDNGGGEFHLHRVKMDVQGRRTALIDPLGRMAMAFQHDMLGCPCNQDILDGGPRWTFFDAAGEVSVSWDARGHRRRTVRDALRRPTHLYLQKDGGAEILAERTVHGELHPDAAARNLRGQVCAFFDQAGRTLNDAFDIQGNLLAADRRLARNYKTAVDWTPLAGAASLEEALSAAEPFLETEIFGTRTAYDALNRAVSILAPDGTEFLPTYDRSGAVGALSARLRGAAAATPFVERITRDAKGRRSSIAYANGTLSEYEYDPLSLRLRRLTSRKGGTPLQDFLHVCDPVGNVVLLKDGAQQAVYFQNAVVEAEARYRYDPLYRLLRAEGREHRGQGGFPQGDEDDGPRASRPHPEDGQALRSYAEEYEYDAAGNILRMAHAAGQGSWTRLYQYAPGSNRLAATSRPGDPDGVMSGLYSHDAHGNMTAMPHLPGIEWNPWDRMSRADLGGGGTAYFVYDADGHRTRKVVETPQGLVKERIYVGDCEVYRERPAGGAPALERWTLHVMDDKKRICLVETATAGADPAPVFRYQLGNHLESCSLELDEDGNLISYEEYYPHGGTSFQSGASKAETSLKRYRHAGQERDEETGLYHSGARYHAPWLGRWTSCDPEGMADGANLYAFARNNPVKFRDASGKVGVNSINGEIGEHIATQFLDKQGLYIFSDWSKDINGNGFDFVAYDPVTKKVWLVDNKAYSSTISEVSSLSGSTYTKNLDEAKKFLQKNTGNEAAAAIKALEKGDVEKVVINAFSKGKAGFSKKLFAAGIKAFDVRSGKLFDSVTAWQAEKKAAGFVSKSRILGRQRGFVTVGSLIFTLVVIGASVYAISESEDKGKAAIEMGKDLAIGSVIAKAVGTRGSILIFMATSLCSDNAAMQEECERRDTVKAFLHKNVPEAFTYESWGPWGMFTSETMDQEIYQQAYDLLFNTDPIQLPATPPPPPPPSPSDPGGITGYTPMAMPTALPPSSNAPPPAELFKK